MKLIYTVCTANYLYQALTLGESLQKTNPDYELIIGLADELPVIDFEIPYQLISIKDLNFPHLEEYHQKYSTLELACACKPIFALHILEKYPDIETLIYCDTDIYFYNRLVQIEEYLQEKDIILTPHITQEIQLTEKWNEKEILNAGLYNAGFIAVKRSENTFRFLNWWKSHLKDYGFYDFCQGMGVDQLCLNFVPIFFENVLIDYNPTHNMAYWNLRERALTFENNQYIVNHKFPLIYFHFSGYNPENQKVLSRHIDLKKSKDNTVLNAILAEYHHALLKNHYDLLKNFVPKFGVYTPPPKTKNTIVKFIEKASWKVINFIENY